MRVAMLLRISLSRFQIGLHNNEIGLYDECSGGVLFGFSMGMILFPDILDIVVRCCMVEVVSEGPYGHWPKMFQVPVGYTIGACITCGIGTVYYYFGYVGKERSKAGV